MIYHAAGYPETSEVEAMTVTENARAETPLALLKQLREDHSGPLTVISANGPAHRGPVSREYQTTPNPNGVDTDTCVTSLPSSPEP